MAKTGADQPEVLAEEGWEHLALGEFVEAKEAAEQLIASQVESGYPLMAQVLLAEDDSEEAISQLKSGISIFPDSWRLLLELGNVYNQAENPKAALEVFDEVEKMPDHEAHWVALNRGVTFFRMGDIDQALNTLQKIEHKDVIAEAFAIQLDILDMVQRHDLIIEMAEEELSFMPTPEGPDEAGVMSRICVKIASAHWYEEDNEEKTTHYLRQAIEYDRTNPDAIWLWREIHPEFSELAHYYDIDLEGLLVDSGKEGGQPSLTYEFSSSYGIIADSPEEALEMIKSYEIEDVDLSSLAIIEIDSEEIEEGEAKGIYYTTPLMILGEAKGDLPDLSDIE